MCLYLYRGKSYVVYCIRYSVGSASVASISLLSLLSDSYKTRLTLIVQYLAHATGIVISQVTVWIVLLF